MSTAQRWYAHGPLTGTSSAVYPLDVPITEVVLASEYEAVVKERDEAQRWEQINKSGWDSSLECERVVYEKLVRPRPNSPAVTRRLAP